MSETSALGFGQFVPDLDFLLNLTQPQPRSAPLRPVGSGSGHVRHGQLCLPHAQLRSQRPTRSRIECNAVTVAMMEVH
jgi:hypothetical protein